MNKQQLLALRELAEQPLADLQAKAPAVFAAVQDLAAAQVKQALVGQFVRAPEAVRDRIALLDLGGALKRGIPPGKFALDSLQGTVPAERLALLGRSQLLSDPLPLGVPIKDQPLLAEPLRQAEVYTVAGVADLADAKVEALLGVAPRLQVVDDDVLDGLVGAGKLDRAEATRFGLATSLTNLLDADLDLVTAVHAHVGALSDLAAWTADQWQSVLQDGHITPPDGATPQAFATDLRAKVAKLLPTDAFLARVVPADLGAIATQVRGGLEPADRDRLAGAYPGLGVAEVLVDPALSGDERAARVTARIELLNRVRALNPGIELLNLDYSLDGEDAATLNLTGLAPDDQESVRSTLKAYQRVYALAGVPEDMQAVLGAGYTTSPQILVDGYAAFLAKTGLPEVAARRAYGAARATVTGLVASMGTALDVIRGGYASLAVANLEPDAADYLKRLSGYEELFGSLAYCRCEECESILGPAAYFVDLMSFIERNVLAAYFAGDRADSPLNLEVRRPDLWSLPLTCQNTTELVPTLAVIGEILESYIARARGVTDVANRTAVERSVYEELLSRETGSFGQPFWLPLARLETYLAHFAESRGSVARTVGVPAPASTAAALGVSALELGLITEPNTNPGFLGRLYGIAFAISAGGAVGPVDAQALLAPIGVSRDDLGQLVGCRFVAASSPSPIQIVSEKSSPDSFQNDIELVQGLTTAGLDRLHRFTRLWRHLPWSIGELDLVLSQLDAGDATPAVLEQVVALRQVQDRLGASAEGACALIGDLPAVATVPGGVSLRDRVFNLPPFATGEPLPAGAHFVHPAFADPGHADDSTALLPRLLGGLRVDDEQLHELIIRLAVPLGIDLASPDEQARGFDLTIGNLSLLYRHARLAELLGLAIPDLFALMQLSDELALGHVAGLADLDALLAFYDWWKSTEYTLDDLGFVTGGPVAHTEAYPDQQAVAGEMLATVGADSSLLFADTVLAFLPTVTEAASRAVITAPDAPFEAVATPDGSTAYRLASAFDPAAPLPIPAGVDVDEGAARGALLRYHASEVVPNLLAAKLGLTPERVKGLLALTRSGLEDPSLAEALKGGAADPLVALVSALLPLAVLFRDDSFDAPALAFVGDDSAIFGISDLQHVGIDSIRALSVYVAFATGEDPRFAGAEPALDPADLRAALEAFTPPDGFGTVDPVLLGRVLGVETGLAKTVHESVRPALPATAPAALARLGQCAGLAKRIGVSGEALALIPASDYGSLARAADAVLGAFRAKHPDEDEFESALQPFEDRILERRRDALVDHLMDAMPLIFESPSDLFYYFLIDPELEGCARTSRVVAATLSAQLYVHRCLMNLEQDESGDVHVLPQSIPADEWVWRKNFRVWQANREIFLYPENYIEPELRDDKTPLFEELESELFQRDVDDEAVLDAYAKYLHGFEEVASLAIAGVYHDLSEDGDVLHLLGVTPEDPPTYYHRTVENLNLSQRIEDPPGVVWSPWRKVEVQIPVRYATPVVLRGRLHLFWTQLTTAPVNEVMGGSSNFVGYDHQMTVRYATLRADGSWTPPQEIALATNGAPFDLGAGRIPDRLDSSGNTRLLDVAHPAPLEPRNDYRLQGPNWEQLFVEANGAAPRLVGRNFRLFAPLDLVSRSVGANPAGDITQDPGARPIYLAADLLTSQSGTLCSALYDVPITYKNSYPNLVIDEQHADLYANEGFTYIAGTPANAALASLPPATAMMAVTGSPSAIADVVLQVAGTALLVQGSVRPDDQFPISRLSTTVAPVLLETLFTAGLDGLLDTEQQMSLAESSPPIAAIGDRLRGFEALTRLDFRGGYGNYFRELFFHIPFLIASHLNGEQRFDVAQRWYEYIFDPTGNRSADELDLGEVLSISGLPQGERERLLRRENWRYREFRSLALPDLRQLLGDQQAIEAYKRDPFNPHAIARLRLSAYPKAIVMKYIDNLLDWGDSLFAQFTRESVNEATLLYVMAADILGRRPPELGDCGEEAVTPRSYAQIAPHLRGDSDFLIELESSAIAKRQRYKLKAGGTYVIDRARLEGRLRTLGGVATATLDGSVATRTTPSVFMGSQWKQTAIAAWATPRAVASVRNPSVRDAVSSARAELLTRDIQYPGIVSHWGLSLLSHISPVFCVPRNDELLGYWDRVEDRLYKIRHCMDITGAERELALFAPEIDPHILVRLRAAGLSLDDVLDATGGQLPPYRFSYLIERAKSYAQVVQGFGSALLGALEKKDVEDLSRLRVVHEQNLQRLGTQSRMWEIDAATDAITALERQQTSTTYRRDYYKGLIDAGKTGSEVTQEFTQNLASDLRISHASIAFLAGVLHLIPQVGSPFAMKYGGVETGGSMKDVSTGMMATAAIADNMAAKASLAAGFERREQGWDHQRQLADNELGPIASNLAAAQIRKELADKALELHQKQIEQTEEIFELYGAKFSNLGLYTWLSTTLQRLHRDAYNGAYSMARLAEQAFRFERGDEDSELLSGGYWDASHAGLLAGERLLLDLQSMERRFLETNYRTLEIDQPFSLAQLSPAALVELRETGTCEFALPEFAFDLFYPGQYRRRIRGARLTIPCITGPYVNVGATLTLLESHMRTDAELGDQHLVEVPLRRSVSISTSTAQNDGGVFELSFRDERYMPFEGAGAVSRWRLSLPASLRQFDYQTINDVILSLAYTAEEDGLLRQQVEAQNDHVEGTLLNYLSTHALARVISFRQDLSGAFNRLLHSPVGTPVQVDLDARFFPAFLGGRTLRVTKALLALRPREGQDVRDVSIAVDGVAQVGFTSSAELGDLPAKDLGDLLSTNVRGQHRFVVEAAGDLAPDSGTPADASALDADKLPDLLLYIEYQAS